MDYKLGNMVGFNMEEKKESGAEEKTGSIKMICGRGRKRVSGKLYLSDHFSRLKF